jgi:hypothetical protein
MGLGLVFMLVGSHGIANVVDDVREGLYTGKMGHVHIALDDEMESSARALVDIGLTRI